MSPLVSLASIAALAAAVASCSQPKSLGSPSDAGADASQQADADVSDSGTGVTLTLALHRGDAGSPSGILADVTAESGGTAAAGLAIDIDVQSMTVPAQDLGAGRYEATIVPSFTSGELPITAHLHGSTEGPALTALVLPNVDVAWDQPVAVGGLVNTPATEDSATISPDGDWLIVGTYVVVDSLCCFSACQQGPADGRNPACQTVLGPYAAPGRPGMPGADRIRSNTQIVNSAPSLCETGPDGGDLTLALPDGGVEVPALPPTAAYGFHRQPDGTFAAPFLIHFDDDGFTDAPFCFSFLSAPSNGQANVLFAYHRDDVGGPNHPYLTRLTLGTENVLGTYGCASGAVDYAPGGIAELAVSPASQNAGNTWEGAGYLWSDDETTSPATTLVAQTFADGGIASWSLLPLPGAGDDRRQPVVFDGRVFYYRNATLASVAWAGADPTQPSSFSDERTELTGDPIPSGGLLAVAPGRVVAVGQPTFATRPGGGVEMYFVYYRRTATGFDGQIGMVASR